MLARQLKTSQGVYIINHFLSILSGDKQKQFFVAWWKMGGEVYKHNLAGSGCGIPGESGGRGRRRGGGDGWDWARWRRCVGWVAGHKIVFFWFTYLVECQRVMSYAHLFNSFAGLQVVSNGKVSHQMVHQTTEFGTHVYLKMDSRYLLSVGN